MKAVILDEAGYFFNRHPQWIVEALRKMDDVPTVCYKVEGERVFVFDKLMAALVEARFPHDADKREAALRDALDAILPQAYVSSVDAVTRWNVTPENFVINESSGVFVIWNTVLKSFIPVTLCSKEDAHRLLADLLVGKNVPTEYDALLDTGDMHTVVTPIPGKQGQVATSYVYPFAGQIYQHNKTDITAFDFSVSDVENFYPFTNEHEMTRGSSGHENSYLEGFPLLPRGHYLTLNRHASEWFLDAEKAAGIACAHFTDAESWLALFAEFDFYLPVTSETIRLNDNEQSLVQVIRTHYPELSAVSDIDLYYVYDDFMTYERHIRTFDESDVFRDDDFLYYFLGEVCSSKIDSEHRLEDKTNIGQIAAFFSSLGFSAADVIAKAEKYSALTKQIYRVTWGCNAVFTYMQELKAQNGLIKTGRPVTTEVDAFRTFRKYNGKLLVATQNLDSFNLPVMDDKTTDQTKH